MIIFIIINKIKYTIVTIANYIDCIKNKELKRNTDQNYKILILKYMQKLTEKFNNIFQDKTIHKL